MLNYSCIVLYSVTKIEIQPNVFTSFVWRDYYTFFNKKRQFSRQRATVEEMIYIVTKKYRHNEDKSLKNHFVFIFVSFSFSYSTKKQLAGVDKNWSCL